MPATITVDIKKTEPVSFICTECNTRVQIDPDVKYNYCTGCDLPYDDQGEPVIGVIEFDEV